MTPSNGHHQRRRSGRGGHLASASREVFCRMMLHRRRRRRRRARTGTVHEVPRMPNSPTRPEHQLDVVHRTIRILPSCVRSCSSDAEQATVGESDNGNILLGLIPPISTGCPAQAPCLFHKRFPVQEARFFNKDSDSEIVDFLEDEGAVGDITFHNNLNGMSKHLKNDHIYESIRNLKCCNLQAAAKSNLQSPAMTIALNNSATSTTLICQDCTLERCLKLLENSPKHRHRSHTISACVNGDQEQQCTMIGADQTHVVAAHNETNLCGYDSYLHQTICAAAASAKHATLHGGVLGGVLTALP
ncbi:conserved hypothetical protein [Culex quinquefasciatus]|uniref:Uncharacterized protein n=1 Tax=Culex quinquefasciatus TaxID=7176 RepID=B0X946_CULQU|nr:conserved hypothetical protein [Culex quinquefasciatus]|eukprot:XP_001866168.1 conserved hypothetical protein [Culex quinquefasciatus]